jgi:hypothetical protein
MLKQKIKDRVFQALGEIMPTLQMVSNELTLEVLKSVIFN